MPRESCDRPGIICNHDVAIHTSKRFMNHSKHLRVKQNKGKNKGKLENLK